MCTGFIVGKFAPLTTGHINFINQASTKCDKLLVLLSYDSRWLDKLTPYMAKKLTLKNRLRWLKETYHNFDHIIIDYVDESNIPEYPNGWKEYTRLVNEKLEKHFGEPTSDFVYSSETAYHDGFSENFPTVQHVLVDPDRDSFPISATMVRGDLFKHWDYLPSSVRKEFVYKVCVIGTESTGKTTLVKYLAKMFATSWVEEYGRKFCEQELFGDETLLEYEDYATIAFRHKEDEERSARTANRVLFSDTNAFITGFYQYMYEGEIDPIVEGMISREEYDLVLYLDNDVPWVDDGLRIHGSPELRKKTKNTLDFLIERYNIDHVRITGSYEERLNKAYNLVKNSLTKAR
jgi:HTH-type transcriptional repressor of NAD biosynthesis genes